ncbi:hypothetical protein AB0H92_32175 [Streptomyces phaeochromogenes]|uniref:hypothetical protein n=1 Tax=Streptomyces phaeochromogenes TaxID=1923 RepID=UPI0033FC08BA
MVVVPARRSTSNATKWDQQRRFEHARDRREPRSQAYADLIAQTQRLGTLINVMNGAETYATDDVHKVMEETTKLLRCRARVAVEGPINVADRTEGVIEAATDCRDALMALASLRGAPPELQATSRPELIELCRDGVESLAESLTVFVDEAREALDDNGGNKQRSDRPEAAAFRFRTCLAHAICN